MASRRYDWAVVGPEILSIYGSVAGQPGYGHREGTPLPAAASRAADVGSMIDATRARR